MMKTIKNILLYFCLMFVLIGYASHEFSNSFLSSGLKLEIFDSQTESESKEFEEGIQAEDYTCSNSRNLKHYYFIAALH